MGLLTGLHPNGRPRPIYLDLCTGQVCYQRSLALRIPKWGVPFLQLEIDQIMHGIGAMLDQSFCLFMGVLKGS
jgi:hypothetical protein